jgi:hypothetical protein
MAVLTRLIVYEKDNCLKKKWKDNYITKALFLISKSIL